MVEEAGAVTVVEVLEDIMEVVGEETSMEVGLRLHNSSIPLAMVTPMEAEETVTEAEVAMAAIAMVAVEAVMEEVMVVVEVGEAAMAQTETGLPDETVMEVGTTMVAGEIDQGPETGIAGESETIETTATVTGVIAKVKVAKVAKARLITIGLARTAFGRSVGRSA